MAEEKRGQFPSSLKETKQHGSFNFPCAFYQPMVETNPPGFPFIVKHHWHEPIEIIYLEQDSYQIDIRHAATLLRTTELPVTEVCLESGFNNLGHFMKEFKKATQFTPLQFRRQHMVETFPDNIHTI
ncbi:MAG: helix-turn-helix domain-containing protein [Lachnospiraceae bacterium]|nr:helix-turn-helix domain-containing protein [Lachnospiraceae bacterium]